MPLAAAAVIGGVVVGLIGWSLRPEMPPQSAKRFSYELPVGQTLRVPQQPEMSFSADGRRFVYNFIYRDAQKLRNPPDLTRHISLQVIEMDEHHIRQVTHFPP